jgi:sterol desaturase/sphingolipid hydroxylase (fatty acid hydroxylase superfamily)
MLAAGPGPAYLACMSIEMLLTGKAMLIAAALVVFFVYERLRPAVDSPLLLRLGHATIAAWRRLGRNMGLFSVNLLLSPLVVVPITAWANLHEVGLRPAWWGGWWGLALDVLLLDFWIYWWHRANHEVPFLWRFHSVHHFDELLDSSSALRFHFGEVFLSACVRAPVILLLGMPLASVVVFEAAILVGAIFHHSDAWLPRKLEAALARIVITPSIHWVHHHAIRADTDSNYGTIFSFWDPLFRSRSRTRRWREMPIGVEGFADRPLLRLVTAPFERNKRVR